MSAHSDRCGASFCVPLNFFEPRRTPFALSLSKCPCILSLSKELSLSKCQSSLSVFIGQRHA
jgi:hypothetical protein